MITTISFDAFMPDLEPELIQCPIPTIERRLREAVIEACEDANVWREEVSVPIEPGITEYDIALGDDQEHMQIHSLLGMTLKGQPLIVNRDFCVDDRGQFTLTRNPSKSGVVVVSITLKPSRGALVMGRVLYLDYHKMIVQGTLSKAYDMKNRRWSNPTEAAKHRVVFEEEIADAKRAIDRQFVTGSQAITPRRFASPSQGFRYGGF